MTDTGNFRHRRGGYEAQDRYANSVAPEDDKLHDDPAVSVDFGKANRAALVTLALVVLGLLRAVKLGWVHHDDDGWYLGEHYAHGV